MLGLAILLLFNLLGVVLHEYAQVPLPGYVIGLLLLLGALFLGVVKVAWVERASELLLRHMMLLFAPVIVVGVLAKSELLASNWLPIAAVIVISTLATLVATAAVAGLFEEKPEPREAEDAAGSSAGEERRP